MEADKVNWPRSSSLSPARAGAAPGARGAERSAPLRPLRRGRCGDSRRQIGAMEELPLPAGINASTFPAKLWGLVNSPRVRSVRWDSQAQGLLIDRFLFERELLSPGGAHGGGGQGARAAPDCFKATHFASFVRQLNLYGFQKVPSWLGSAVPGDAGAWLHFMNPNFRRDRPELLLRIKRRTRANRQRLAAGLEVRSRQPSRLQRPSTDRSLPAFPTGQPPRAAPLRQKRDAASPEDSELPPGPSKRSAGAQESEASPAAAKKVCATSGLVGASPVEPSRELIQRFNLRKLTVPLVRLDLKRHPELMVHLTPIHPEAACRPLGHSNSCSSSQQHSPACEPSAPSCQKRSAASPEDSELPAGPSRTSPDPPGREASPARAKKVFAPSALGVSSDKPGTHKFQFQPQLITPAFPAHHQSTSAASPESSSCTSPEQHLPANIPSAAPGTSVPSAPAGSAGYAAWRAPSWVWSTPGEEELPPLDLDLVLETLEEMLSPSVPERSPSAQVNPSVARGSSGGEAVNKAAAEGALPVCGSCVNVCQEPKELDIHLIYLARRAALRGKKDQRESL
ncbi:heat shock factor protein 4-like [Poecile atricapillus]|uniref:heat shock factor protein 4-like n=1 Tax=Poecile atricapillus TaxID=48891 RepID=UPI0027396FEC|nr:heat shock factor protein 4-like [Poecile atricapillus]